MSGELLEIPQCFNLKDLVWAQLITVGCWPSGAAMLIIDGKPYLLKPDRCRYLADMLNSTADAIDPEG